MKVAVDRSEMSSYLASQLNKHRQRIRKYRFLSFLFIVTLSNFILLYLSVHQNNLLLYLIDDSLPLDSIIEDEGNYSIETEGCRIPALQVYDENVHMMMKQKFSFDPCPKKETALLETNDTHIWVIKDNLKYHYNFTNYDSTQTLNFSLLLCCYQEFFRPRAVADVISSNTDQRMILKKCTIFDDIVDVNPNHEFVSVSCYYNRSNVYNKLLANVPKKKMKQRPEASPPPNNGSQYNVLVIGIDSVSRINFRRAMPKTWRFLKSLEAVEFFGYNKVGDDTFSNAVPLLMGIKHTELQNTCVPHKYASFDNCPLVWEWFKQAGYYTAFAEDSSTHGIFNYLRGGFLGFPTDYYLHPFNAMAEIVGNNYNNIYKRKLCLQERFMYEVLLDYIQKLTETLANSNLFGFFWDMNLSHDGLKNTIVIDRGYENLFRRLNESGYLNKTVVIFLSDHGMRFGDIFKTEQRGWLETRLPFVFILLPPSFRTKYSLASNSLKLNSKRLTTPFDIHKTLVDLIDLRNIENDAILLRSKQYYTQERGISLFLPIPGNRTCKMADIEDTWCTCHKTLPIALNNPTARNASKDLIVHLNSLISAHHECATLKLSKITRAMEMTIAETEEKLILLSVRVMPGGGKFHATMRMVGRAWQPVGVVTRYSRYGDQSKCINWYHLKMYCYCKDYKEKV